MLHEQLVDGLTEAELRSGKGSPKQKAAWQEAEWRRCAASCLYWLEHYGWIIMKDSSIIRWHLWPVQIKLIKEWERHESCVAVKSRQLGITTLSVHFALWEIIFKEAARWSLFSSSEDKAKDIISRVQATKDRLPPWMVHRAQSRNSADKNFVKRQDKSDAVSRISFGLSEMKIMTSTPKSIQGAIGNFILDEFTLHTDQKRKLHMMFPAMDGGGMGIVIANGNGEDEFYNLYQRAKAGKNKFKWHFLSWRDDPTHNDEWYVQAEEQFLLDPSNSDFDISVFKAMYPSNENEAFFLGGNSRFKTELLNKKNQEIRSKHEVSPPKVGFLDTVGGEVVFREDSRGKWVIFEEPRYDCEYAMGVDPSGGTPTGDFAVIQVGKVQVERRATQVARFQARVEPSILAYEAEKCGMWYNQAEINVEANNHGGLVLDKLKQSYPNLYMRKRTSKLTPEGTDLVGYYMDGNSKQYIIDQLAEWIHLDYLELNDTETVKELVRYEVKENLRTGAGPGAHDDLVLALAHMVECAVDTIAGYIEEQPRILMPWEA